MINSESILLNYFKVAFRGLMKNRLVSAINIFGLAVELVCCMLIVLYIRNETGYDAYHKNIRQIYQVGTIFVTGGKEDRFPAMIAGPLAWLAMNKWLQSFTLRIPVPWTVFAFTTGMVLVIAFSTICIQTVRAALANPVKSLKSE